MQGGERNVLQRGDDVGPVRYDDVGSCLRDVTVCDRLIECVVRKAGERYDIALRICTMGLETNDRIVSALT